MSGSYFGEPNMGNERGGGGGSSSSRKGKKSSSEKPKQPQRGLGVAQLEKIRLHEQMGSSYYPPLHGPYPANFNQDDMRAQSAAGYSSMAATSSFSYSSSSPTSSASYGFHPNMMMGLGEYDQRATSINYGDSQPSTTSSWNHDGGILGIQPNMTRRLLGEDVQPEKSKKHLSNSSGSSTSHNSESNEAQELDLELRLSL